MVCSHVIEFEFLSDPRTIIGLVVEIVGFVNLFGNFFPLALAFMRRLPLLGTFLNLPYISAVLPKSVSYFCSQQRS